MRFSTFQLLFFENLLENKGVSILVFNLLSSGVLIPYQGKHSRGFCISSLFFFFFFFFCFVSILLILLRGVLGLAVGVRLCFRLTLC